MQKKIVWLLLLIAGVRVSGRAQSMVPVIQKTQSTIAQIEKDGDVVDVALYDYIFKDNNSTYSYEFQFYKTDSYEVRVFGDDLRTGTFMIRILRYVGTLWQKVEQTDIAMADASVTFTPPASERYRIEVSCGLLGSNTSGCFGMIIKRKE